MIDLEEIYLHGQIMRIGLQTAYERTAHFLLEVYFRLRWTGFTQDDGFVLPISQESLSQALGLSAVHMNRTLQQLRHEGMINRKGRVIRIVAVEAMAALCDFELPCALSDLVRY